MAGESSGELYGALLARSVKASFPDALITGIGGERMAEAGVELISRISSSFGAVEALRTYRTLRNTFGRAVGALETFRPQVVVLIDYPDFNMRLAAEARKRGIRVLYYVSPQVWAWRKKRIYTLARTVDKMAVILPFEVGLYSGTGLPCEFVGHPAMDEIRQTIGAEGFGLQDIGSTALKAHMKRKLGVDPDKPLLAIMPGSRRHEISKLLPVLSRTVSALKQRYPDYQYVIPVAPNIDWNLFAGKVLPKECVTVHGKSIETLTAADTGIIASGTSTLQAALLGVPMTVVYKMSALTIFLARLILNVKYISLVNLLLERSAAGDAGLRVKELIQEDASAANILSETARLIDDTSYRHDMLMQLNRVRELYRDRSASARAAEMITELIQN